VNDKVVRGREADRGYGLGYPTTLTGQLQSAVIHAGAPFAILQPRNRRFLPNLCGGVVLIWILSAGQRQNNTRNR
jgi:hypothetical protein